MRSILWRNLLFFGALAAYSSLLRAGLPDGVIIEPPPAWVVPVTPASAGQPKLNPAGQDFLLLDRQINVATDETYVRRSFQIVSDEGRRNGGQVSIDFDPSYQTLTLHHLRLVREGQVIDKLDPDRVQLLQQERDLDRQLYNGERSALVILEDLRIGDVVDLAFTLHGCNPVFAGRFIDVVSLGWGVPVKELRCRVLTPAERSIHHQIRGESRPEFTEQLTAAGRELRWVCRDLPALDADDQTPSWHTVFPFLELTEFESWAEVTDWARPLYAIDAQPTPRLTGIIDQISRAAATTDDRVVAALRFVQEEIRYLGIELGAGSHLPSEPEDVLQRRFGDCKDKSRLLVAILSHLGIEAMPALVHSTRRDTVGDWLPSPFAFDHVVVVVNLGPGHVMLDPTLAYQRGTSLESRKVGRYGPYLPIAADNLGLMRATPGESDRHFTHVLESFRVTSVDEPAELTVRTTYHGTAANQIRAWFATLSMEQALRQNVDFYTRYYPGLDSVSAKLFKHDDDARNIVEVTETYRIPHLFVPPATGTVLKAEFYPAVLGDYLRTPNLGARRHPLSRSFPTRVKFETRVHLPSDWPPATTHRRIEHEAFTFTYDLNSAGRTLELKYEWESHRPEVPVAHLESFRARNQEAMDLLGYQLTYNTAIAQAGFFLPQWPMVLLAISVLSAGTFAGWRLLRLQNPVPPEPPLLTSVATDPYSYSQRSRRDANSLGGWLLLVGCGLMLRPWFLIYALQQGIHGYFNRAAWDILTSPGSAAYQPHFATVAPVELVLNLSLLIWNLVLLVLFFRRSYIFPRTMQAYLGFQLIAVIFFAWSLTLFTNIDAATQAEAYRGLSQGIGGALIWIPYFQFSRRVKHTFTR